MSSTLTPYEPPASIGEKLDDAASNFRKPRLGRWHAGLWLVLVGLFSYWAVQWVIDWETTRGRTAPTERLVWNALTIHTGPLAGVFYWDYGYSQPSFYLRTKEMISGRFRTGHLPLSAIVLPAFLVLTLPSTGCCMKPVRLGWRILIGVAFVVGTALWYFSAMISIAMLS